MCFDVLSYRFKGVDEKRDMFICRPVIGYSRGAYPRFNKAAVYKVKVFGVGVFEEETRRTRWERLPSQTKERFILLFLPFAELAFLFSFIHLFVFMPGSCKRLK
jgi:hypothetical protein